MNLLFEFQNGDCNIRNSHVLSTDLRKTGIYGLGTVIYRAPNLLVKQNLPSECKLTSFREEFRVHLKKWKFYIWPFRSCKTFETNLGFIN